MKILALDSSSNVASVALADDDVLISENTVNNKKTHSQTLMPMVEAVLKAADEEIAGIDAFAVCVGPGSFTGLRIGVATAKGLAHACNKPLVCVSTLEAMAYNLPYCEHLLVPILDARRNQVYGAIYYWKDEALYTHTEPCATAIDDIVDIVKNEKKKAVFIGDGVCRFKEYIMQELGDNAVFSFANSNMQRASSVAALAQRKTELGETVEYDKAVPIYLRKSQAEREYDEKSK